ncbi:hypothetical protein ASPACDRAFT_127631 [Aspergillus aculeatus ATCC 16872]|uniref:Metallo-beta-lactamase domain-containing protein n=1 Tax=Aspergillus aculeatus (strain ATCC 16872 / CBS 172.66 / WB 5094) TaxID=690307 RepID=A0A1L9WG43_ASPA1|nr:uncharacterized protein ASPACDRAFT_127631 [Aspergillus aculeatus ATCC 16872]OJJ95142.1 hypothetical protein ASPACDRAFT_127631 [Aspergillus aculeatus ATCC 16872]
MAKTLDIPQSNHTVRVKMVDTTTMMSIRTETLIQPVQSGHEFLNMTDVAFLIESEALNKKVMFDLGTRKDYWNLPTVAKSGITRIIPALKVEKDVGEILTESGITLEGITSIIWSHYHWDHVGDVSKFPASTALIVGPGFLKDPSLLPGYPENLNSPVPADAFQGREVIEPDFPLNVAGYRAHDFFEDGSFYLLDTPGHCVGHVCGLARTTKDTFILLGGDICHFAGAIRPTADVPFPAHFSAETLDNDPFFPVPCPCSIFADRHPITKTNQDKTPFHDVSALDASVFDDPAVAQQSVEQLRRIDASPNVLICIAHDPELLRHLPTLNRSPELDLNAWKEQGWKERVRWGWVNELPRAARPGRQALVEGFWREGKIWEGAFEELCAEKP